MPPTIRRQPVPPSTAWELLAWWRSEFRDWFGGIFGDKARASETTASDITVVRDGILLGAAQMRPHDVADLRDRGLEVGGSRFPRSVTITLAEGRFLNRRLADQRVPLVRAQKMAELDVETQTPFRLDDIYILFADPTPQDVGTYYYLVRRNVLDPLLDALSSGRRRLVGLTFAEAGHARSVSRFALSALTGGRGDLLHAWRSQGFGIACLVLIAVAGYNVSTALAEALSATEGMIERVSPKAKAARQAFKEQATQFERIEAVRAERNAYVPVVRLLEELSVILPDTTYLTSVSVRQGRIKVTGFSQDAAALIPLIDSSALFVNPRFVSAVVKAPDRNVEQFDLEAEVEYAG